MKIHGPYLRKDGRKHVVIIHDDGTRQTRSYPRLLLEEKLGRPLEKWETVDHEDGDHTNDSPSNLRVLTRVENAKHGWVTGNLIGHAHTDKVKKYLRSVNLGANNPTSVLSADQVFDIRNRKPYYGFVRDLMLEFGVCRKTIYNALKGKTYQAD